MIHNFKDFLLESDGSAQIADLLTSLTRNYKSTDSFRTDLSHFDVDTEERHWEDARQHTELEKTVTHDATYKLLFKLDQSKYKLYIDFTFSFYGSAEKDAPDNNVEEGKLATILDRINIKRLKIESDKVNVDTKNVKGIVKKSLDAFLIKMLELEYDSISPKIYSLEQQK